MAESVKVIVRCRPMNDRERGLNCKDVVSIDSRTASCSISSPSDKKAPPKTFTFDGAYDIYSSTEQIYADIGFPLVEGITEGYNGTIFAYGQTGCGKSFTMQGIPDPASQKGIIPRAFDHIFETIQTSENSKYLVHASYLEIYNEEIRDLLGKDIKQKLDLKENPDKGIYVQSLSKHPCKNVGDCEKVMEKGWKNRSTGATLMNADSSRSHSIFTIHLERYDTDSRKEHIKAAKLNLVDLAGSERQAKTGATGDRLKEATKINLSLSALGNVISALVDGKSTHIPYRDSKLTRLLQDSLGGNTKTLMIACLSPADNNYDETLSTLRYANRAKNIKNKPKINEDPKDAMLREYQKEIERLKAMLKGEAAREVPPGGDGDWNSKDAEAEKTRLRKEFEAETKKLREELKSMKLSKEQVENEMNKLKTKYEKQVASVGSSSDVPSLGSKVEEEEELLNDIDGPEQTSPVHAVHMGTHKKKPDKVTTAEEASKRLQELEQNFVGGEQSNNEEVKERRRKKKKYAEERNKKLQEALAMADGDEIVAGIFKDVQDELKFKHRLLEKEKQKSEALRCEIMDLQTEFEQDRKDYLDTIRKQEQQLKYYQAVISRLHPLVRKDCNFTNLEKIKSQSEWDEINKIWILPKVVIEKNHLPLASNPNNAPPQSKDFHDDFDFYDDQRFMQRLQNSDEQEIAKNYFKNSRAEELLNASLLLESSAITRMKKSSPQSPEGEESLVRKPVRLEALPAKGKRRQNRN